MMQVLEAIINFILEQNEIRVCDIASIPNNVGEIVIKTFEHCKNRSVITIPFL